MTEPHIAARQKFVKTADSLLKADQKRKKGRGKRKSSTKLAGGAQKRIKTEDGVIKIESTDHEIKPEPKDPEVDAQIAQMNSEQAKLAARKMLAMRAEENL